MYCHHVYNPEFHLPLAGKLLSFGVFATIINQGIASPSIDPLILSRILVRYSTNLGKSKLINKRFKEAFNLTTVIYARYLIVQGFYIDGGSVKQQGNNAKQDDR